MEFNNWIYNIASAKKKTMVTAYISYQSQSIEGNIHQYQDIWYGEYDEIKKAIQNHKDAIHDFHIVSNHRNSAIDLLDLTQVNARIEPGAIIRKHVLIKDGCVIMMGAILNVGAVIEEETMIDMGAVIGGRAQIGKRCHIGANAVIAGVIEPPSAKAVVIEDDVMVGANAVILEGVHVKKGAIIAAGAIVCEDVEENCVVAGMPAKVIKIKDEHTIEKTKLVKELRNLK